MDFKELIPTIAVLIGFGGWVINLMIENRSLKDKVERLEHENSELKEYAKHSKP